MSAPALEAALRIQDAYAVAQGGDPPAWATDQVLSRNVPYGLVGPDSTGQLSIYLRGSLNRADWIANLKVLPVPTSEGFNEEGMWEIFCGLSLKSSGFLLNTVPGAFWYGHSQGGTEAALGFDTFSGAGYTLFDPARAVSGQVIQRLAMVAGAVYSVDGSPLPDLIPFYDDFSNRISLPRPVDVEPGIPCHELETIVRALRIAAA